MRTLVLVVAACGAAPGPNGPLTNVASSSVEDAPSDDDVSVVAPARWKVPDPSHRDARMVRDMVKARRAELQACYAMWSAGASPPVTVAFTIGPDGRVQRSRAVGAQGGLENCIADAYRGQVFGPPARGGSLVVRYPYSGRWAGP